MSIAPLNYRREIIKAFGDVTHPAYGQIATVDSFRHPQVRTVHFHYLKSFNAIGFNTHIDSTKWKEISMHPCVSGCYYDLLQLIQFRWEAKTELIEPSSKKHHSLLQEMWMKMRLDVREAYWKEAGNKKANFLFRSPNMGCVVTYPYRWHIYKIHMENFSKGKCTEHILKHNRWTSHNVSLVHGLKELR